MPISLARRQANFEDDPPSRTRKITTTGWIRSIRAHSKVTFLSITDGSLPGSQTLQAVLKGPVMKELMGSGQVKQGAAISLKGQLKAVGKPELPCELVVEAGEVVGSNEPETHPILTSSSGDVEVIRRNPHLRAAHPRFASTLRVRSEMEYSIANFFRIFSFTRVSPPIMTASDCEGAGEVFRVTDGDKKADGVEGNAAYLTVSSQLHLEALMLGLGKVYTINPAFRAEDSATNRHLREFWMCEAELVVQKAEKRSEAVQVMDVVEEMVKAVIRGTLSGCKSELDIDEVHKGDLHKAAKEEWQRITYTEALEMLASSHGGDARQWGSPLSSEDEKWLARDGPVFVTDYPAQSKPFYMRLNDSDGGKTVAAFDLLIPRVGELAGGSLREDSPAKLLTRMKELKLLPADATEVPPDHPLHWYIVELRKYGMPPHGGFGVGIERLLSWITGTDSVRECIPFPRVGRRVRF